MSAHGQLGFDGSEATDPRIEKAAKTRWLNDAKRTWGQDGYGGGNEPVYIERARTLWPRIQRYYLTEAEATLRAAGVL
jgi:hypothetical protein